MQAFVILAAIAGCCLATTQTAIPMISNEPKQAGSVLLERPSPINPEIPMAPKPPEKIVLITDPTELSKYKNEYDEKAESDRFVAVRKGLQDHTILPLINKNMYDQRQKRHDHILTDSKKVQPLNPTEKSLSASKATSAVSSPSPTPKRTFRPRKTPSPGTSKTAAALPSTPRPKRDVEFVSSTSNFFIPTPATSAVDPKPPNGKRDIPVPLVPKNHHSEESQEKENAAEAKIQEHSSDHKNLQSEHLNSFATTIVGKTQANQHGHDLGSNNADSPHPSEWQKPTQHPHVPLQPQPEAAKIREHPLFRTQPVPVAGLRDK